MAEEKREQKSEHGPHCSHCGSTNVYGISRVVGYFSRINNWNKSKTAEFKDRQKGNYFVPQTPKAVEEKFDSKALTQKASCA